MNGATQTWVAPFLYFYKQARSSRTAYKNNAQMPNNRTNRCQITEQIAAKPPNKSTPNHRKTSAKTPKREFPLPSKSKKSLSLHI